MSGQDAYRTVLARGSEQFIINKSRFIGHGAPCRTEEEALDFLAGIRREHKDASHNCYAYVIAATPGIARYSDDGEPSGTAGRADHRGDQGPRRRGRVRGGDAVLRRDSAGGGRLIRAYAQGSKAALDAARVVVMHKTHRYLFDADYAMVGKLDYFLKFQPVRVNARDFAASVTYDVSVKQEDAPAFLAGLVEASLGRVEPLLLEEDYGPWDEADAPAAGAEKE